jgi:hypothetical protein
MTQPQEPKFQIVYWTLVNKLGTQPRSVKHVFLAGFTYEQARGTGLCIRICAELERQFGVTFACVELEATPQPEGTDDGTDADANN